MEIANTYQNPLLSQALSAKAPSSLESAKKSNDQEKIAQAAEEIALGHRLVHGPAAQGVGRNLCLRVSLRTECLAGGTLRKSIARCCLTNMEKLWRKPAVSE